MTAPRAKKNQHYKIGMISLGCPKTLVDSEIILGKLDPQVYEIQSKLQDCDVALLNTCSFIKDAQQESIDRILELVDLKKKKKIKALVVMGCLVQEFPKDLKKELTEVDAFVGSGEYHKIPDIVEKVTHGKKVFSVGTPGYLATSAERRVALTPRHYRYLKISEGCDHVCTFCTIPSFRGKHRSRPMADILNEARQLVEKGAKEIILTGQDTTYYGRDLSEGYLLHDLLRNLNEIPGAGWIRLLYAYPSCITQELMSAIAESDRICKYLDMPLQHASDRMLSAMRRGITQRRTVDLVKQFRSVVPNLAIRTTFIVGFPGETDDDFKQLLSFMSDMKFERVGVFKYSNEENAAASSLPGQIEESVKEERYQAAMLHQQSISRENNQRLIGKKMKVIIEAKTKKKQEWVARSEMDAPDVDAAVYVQSDKDLEIGTFQTVLITDSQEYDLIGKV